MIRRGVSVAGRAFALYFIEGLCKDGAVQHLTDTLYQLDAQTVTEPSDITAICRRCVSAAEVSVISDYGEAADALLSGMTLLLCDGVGGCVCADCRGYPHRSITEPENDKVLRGPRVGFTETLINNTALIRRHIRDARLTVECHRVGRVSRTDVVICYMDGTADPDYVQKLRSLIDSVDADSLTMGAQSLAECLIKKKWYDPFPKIRYTERPDCAAAHILDGARRRDSRQLPERHDTADRDLRFHPGDGRLLSAAAVRHVYPYGPLLGVFPHAFPVAAVVSFHLLPAVDPGPARLRDPGGERRSAGHRSAVHT